MQFYMWHRNTILFQLVRSAQNQPDRWAYDIILIEWHLTMHYYWDQINRNQRLRRKYYLNIYSTYSWNSIGNRRHNSQQNCEETKLTNRRAMINQAIRSIYFDSIDFHFICINLHDVHFAKVNSLLFIHCNDSVSARSRREEMRNRFYDACN